MTTPLERAAGIVAETGDNDRALALISSSSNVGILGSEARSFKNGDWGWDVDDLDLYPAGVPAQDSWAPTPHWVSEIELECIDNWGEGTCSGPVDWHSVDPGRAKAFPRCSKHWGDRLDRRENSMERYADSDVVPAWFDPTYAGEEW